jgi:hypothetical protein
MQNQLGVGVRTSSTRALGDGAREHKSTTLASETSEEMREHYDAIASLRATQQKMAMGLNTALIADCGFRNEECWTRGLEPTEMVLVSHHRGQTRELRFDRASDADR